MLAGEDKLRYMHIWQFNRVIFIIKYIKKDKLRYQENAIFMKYKAMPRHQKRRDEEQIKTNATYETTDGQRRIAIEDPL